MLLRHATKGQGRRHGTRTMSRSCFIAKLPAQGRVNAWKANIARGMRESAQRRQCPACGRRGALRITHDEFVGRIRTCRWCQHED